MQNYLLLQMYVCVISVVEFTCFQDDLFFQESLIHSCGNATSKEEYCSQNHAYVESTSDTKATLFLKLDGNEYRLLLNKNIPFIFAPNAKLTLQTENTSWSSSISNSLNLTIFEGTDANGNYACGLVTRNTFKGFLIRSDGLSTYIETFLKQNSAKVNNRIALVTYKANPVSIKGCSSWSGNHSCDQSSFAEILNCKMVNNLKISCFLDSRVTKRSFGQRLAADYVSTNWTNWLPLMRTRNTSCNILVSSHLSNYTLQHHLESAVSELALVLKYVNRVLSSTDFDGDGQGDGFSLRIGGIVLKQSNSSTVDEGSGHSDESLSKLVDDFRKRPQDKCMSLLFVNLPTESNMVSTTYGGGICKSNDNKPAPARNVAVINSMDSHGTKIPLFVTAWIVTAAVGQVMGSVNTVCNSLLLAIPDKNQTSFFSECSRLNVATTLQRHGSCFEFPEDVSRLLKPHTEDEVLKSPCGNGRVDPGEECDCGTEESCKKRHSCCVPPGEKNECRYNRAKGYECDWRDDCCTRDCKIVPQSWNIFCGRGDVSCSPSGSYCDGRSSRCPVSKSAASLMDGRPCGPANLKHAGAATCRQGRCNSTVCRDAGLRDCICAASTGQQCRVCCKLSLEKGMGLNGDGLMDICIPAEYFGLKPEKKQFYYRFPGTPCNEVRLGHCDRYGKCIQLQIVTASTAKCLHVTNFMIPLNLIIILMLTLLIY